MLLTRRCFPFLNLKHGGDGLFSPNAGPWDAAELCFQGVDVTAWFLPPANRGVGGRGGGMFCTR